MDINFDDPVTGKRWDLSKKEVQEKVMKDIRKEKPLCIGMSPECRLFSILQNLRKTPIDQEEWKKAVSCIDFCVQVAEYQLKMGRFFYFEHPLSATSWQLTSLSKLMHNPEVQGVVVHMCQFGRQANKGGEGEFAKKPTRVITNMPSIASGINRTCKGDRSHTYEITTESREARSAIHSTVLRCDCHRDSDLLGVCRNRSTHWRV